VDRESLSKDAKRGLYERIVAPTPHYGTSDVWATGAVERGRIEVK
jgi:hypothetical protein